MPYNEGSVYERVKQKILSELVATSFHLYSYSGLYEIPPEIGDMLNLESLYITYCYHLQTLPEELANLKKLKHLSISHMRFSDLPQVIGELPNLESLSLAFRDFPKKANWSALAKLNNLKKLELSAVLLKRRTLPNELFDLTQLQELSIRQNQLSSLPAKFAQLQNLEYLNSGGNSFTSFPPVLTELPKLKTLAISAKIIDQIPYELLELQALEKLEVTGKNSQKYKQVYYLEKFLKATLKKGLDKTHKRFVLDLIKHKYSVEELENKQLLSVLDSGLENLTNAAFAEIEKRIKTNKLLVSRPLNKQSKVVFKGKTGGKISQLKSKLRELGATTGTKIQKGTTHVVLGKMPGVIYEDLQKQNCSLLTEQLLIQQLNQLAKPYLLETGKTDEDNLTHLRNLLLSEQEESILLAFEIMHGGGFPSELLTELFLVYKDKTTDKVRREIMRFVKQYAPTEFATALKRRLSINGRWVTEFTIQQNLEYYCRTAPLNKFKIANYLLKKYKKGLLFGLHNLESKQKIIYLKQLITAEGKLKLSGWKLRQLPAELEQLPEIKILDISRNLFAKIPKTLLRMKNLEVLSLIRNEGLVQFPRELLDMPNLRQIFISWGLRQMPSRQEQRAANCKINFV